MGKKMRRDPHNFVLQQQLLPLSKRELKKAVQKNKWAYKNSSIQKMNWSKKEGKTCWKLLDKPDKKER